MKPSRFGITDLQNCQKYIPVCLYAVRLNVTVIRGVYKSGLFFQSLFVLKAMARKQLFEISQTLFMTLKICTNMTALKAPPY